MIVVKELDIDAIEKTGFYNGKYFVLGATLPFLTEKPSEVINIRELVNLIHSDLQKQEEKIEEIIFALPATDEGENTIEYLKKTLSQIVGIEKVKMSTLARGLSTGLDIEYVDRNTFQQAFTHRE
jgi:recombination protein RecR